MKKPLILITNDDGIESPGLRAAAEALLDVGELVIVAPSIQMTSAGRSYKAEKNEYLKRIEYNVDNCEINAFHINATPAFALSHAFLTLFKNKKPDIVISGINYGENLGSNITISGTVGAAIEAACFNIPALAISLQTPIEYHFSYGDVNWEAAKHFLREYTIEIIINGLPESVDLYNINIPEKANIHTHSRMTRVSRKPYFYNWLEDPDFESRIGDNYLKINLDDIEPDSDIYAIGIEKVVSVTPINIDMTATKILDVIEKFNNNQ